MTGAASNYASDSHRIELRRQCRADDVGGNSTAFPPASFVRKSEGKVHAYTYELHGYGSHERGKAEALAHHLKWPLSVITVPTRNSVSDFKRLAIRHRCKKKVQFEVLFKFLYVVPEVEEHEVWTGFNADDHYGNTRQVVFDQARLRRRGLSTAERKRPLINTGRKFTGIGRPDFF